MAVTWVGRVGVGCFFSTMASATADVGADVLVDAGNGVVALIGGLAGVFVFCAEVAVAVGTTITGSTKVGIGVRTIGLGVLVGVGVGIGARDVQAPMDKIVTRRNAPATKMQKMCLCGVVIDKWLTICYLVGDAALMTLNKDWAAV